MLLFYWFRRRKRWKPPDAVYVGTSVAGKAVSRLTLPFAEANEQGQGLVEYGLSLMLVALVVLLALVLFGDTVHAQYCSVTHQVAPDADISEACAAPIVMPTQLDSGPGFINIEARIYDPDGDQNNPYAAIDRVEFYLDSISEGSLIRTEGIYRYCLGGGDSNCNNYSISSLPSGRHRIIVLAYDDDGNVGRKSYTFLK